MNNQNKNNPKKNNIFINDEWWQIFFKNDNLSIHQNYKNNSLKQPKNKTELWKLVYSNGFFYLNWFEFFLQKYKKFNKNDFHYLDLILLDQRIDLNTKVYIYANLVDQKINYKFCFFNNYWKQKFNLNPSIDYDNFKQFNELVNLIDKHYFKDPSKAMIANNQLKLLANVFFPKKINYSNQEIINIITNLIEHYFDQSVSLIRHELVDIIKKINC